MLASQLSMDKFSTPESSPFYIHPPTDSHQARRPLTLRQPASRILRGNFSGQGLFVETPPHASCSDINTSHDGLATRESRLYSGLHLYMVRPCSDLSEERAEPNKSQHEGWWKGPSERKDLLRDEPNRCRAHQYAPPTGQTTYERRFQRPSGPTSRRLSISQSYIHLYMCCWSFPDP